MRLHFLVLVAAVLFIVVDGHPLLKRSDEEDEEAAPSDINDGEKKDKIEDAKQGQDENAEKKTIIPSKKEKDTGDVLTEKRGADITSDEVHEVEEDDDESEMAKKDEVKPAAKDQSKSEDVKEADVKNAIVPSKEKKHDTVVKAKKRHTKTDKPANKKSTDKTADKKSTDKDNSKKWWMVGDSPHWGGRGHGHWGPPHNENYHGGHEGGHGGSHHKSHIPACCKSKDKNVRKRCECEHHEEEEDPHHLHGYHFHEHGHGGHNDHDHDLKGPWAFGYDGFGDDWNDWDHNRDNFDHLQDLDRESHEGHHGGHGEHHGGEGEHDCSKRDCVEVGTEGVPDTHLQTETVGAPVVAHGGVANNLVANDAAQVVETDAAPIITEAPILGAAAPTLEGGVPILGGGVPILGGGAPILGAGAAPIIGPGPASIIATPLTAAPGSPLAMPPMPLVPLPAPAAHHPYRVCHDCHVLKNGGSRCLCKSVKHHAHHANTHYDHHVYIDCDAAVHNYPYGNHICYPRADIPTPESELQTGGQFH